MMKAETSNARRSQSVLIARPHVGVSQNYGHVLGVPIIRMIVFGGLSWGPLAYEATM